MAATIPRLRRIGYQRARLLLLSVGLVVLLVIAGVTYVRRVDTVEVAATLLFIPIFVALVFWKAWGGLVAGLAGAGAYLLLRIPAIDAVGIDPFLGLILSRSLAFVAFGVIGGWAVGQLEGAIRKQDLYDQIDDATGLFNARYFLQDTDLELARSSRYRTIFSVCWVDLPVASLNGMSRRRAARAVRELGRTIQGSIREVDRAVHAQADGFHRLAVILPETGREGAQVFGGRFVEAVAGLLSERGVKVDQADLRQGAATLPEDKKQLTSLRSEFAEIDRAEHPESPPPSKE